MADNHDLISMKLYQLTVQRTTEEEEQDQQEVTIPSVDNMALPKGKMAQEEEGDQIAIALCFFVLPAAISLVVPTDL